MLRAVLNKFWRRHSTKPQLYSHLPSISKTIQIRLARYAGPCWRSKVHTDEQVLGDQPEPIYNSSVLTQYVAWKTYRKRWTIETSGVRGSGKSVQASRHDDDDDDSSLWENKAIFRPICNQRTILNRPYMRSTSYAGYDQDNYEILIRVLHPFQNEIANMIWNCRNHGKSKGWQVVL